LSVGLWLQYFLIVFMLCGLRSLAFAYLLCRSHHDKQCFSATSFLGPIT
jgi:hypothetical protein